MFASQARVLSELLQGVRGATLVLHLEDGTQESFGEGQPLIRLRWTARATLRALQQATVGFCDGYVDGDWSLIEGTLLDLFTCLAGSKLHQHLKSGVSRSVQLRLLLEQLSSIASRRRVHSSVRSHYDLGNEFFSLWLDESMTYTCGYALTAQDTLEQLQQQKLELVCRKLRLQPGQTLVDLGCGWGSLARHAARHHGVQVTAVNISEPQLQWLQAGVTRDQLGSSVSALQADFREVSGTFDRVASIGLAEHVGKRGIPALFRTVAARLRIGGIGLVHTIGSADEGGTDPWIERRIFPGSYVPSLSELIHASEQVGLRVCHVEDIGYSYGATLRHWLRRFDQARPRIERMYDEAFVRRWELYLTMLIPTFELLSTSVFQLVVSRGVGASSELRYPLPAANQPPGRLAG